MLGPVFAAFGAAPDHRYVIVCQLVLIGGFARCRAPAVFGYHVQHIIFLRADEQMRRINAAADIALMQDIQADRYSADIQHPRNPMRPRLSDIDSPHQAVTFAAKIPDP